MRRGKRKGPQTLGFAKGLQIDPLVALGRNLVYHGLGHFLNAKKKSAALLKRRISTLSPTLTIIKDLRKRTRQAWLVG